MKKLFMLTIVILCLVGCGNTTEYKIYVTEDYLSEGILVEEILVEENLEENVDSNLEGIEKYSKEYIEELYYYSGLYCKVSDSEHEVLRDQGYIDIEVKYILVKRNGLLK